ncbi:uncharacterized protein LOC143919228 [Arctopsyche grandis]|uniref:uncharacterized protein LOC143919196 n=1 Tax=Arctopsyche grandis TaxID=121162 RepID=UPI00406D8454
MQHALTTDIVRSVKLRFGYGRKTCLDRAKASSPINTNGIFFPFGSFGKDVQSKWKHVRYNFRREYQAQKDVTSGQGAKKRKKYRYYDELLFLVPHVKDANTSGNYSTATNVTEQNIESPSTPIGKNSPAGSSTATRNIPEIPKKKNKTKSSFEEEVLKAIKNEISETNEDKTFCLSLVQSLQKMDDDNKMLAKIEILKVIRTFSNRSLKTNFSQPNQSPNIEPYFSYPNSIPSLQSTPICTQITQQQHSQLSQPTFTQVHNMYQQHSESHPTLSLHQSSSVNPVHPSKVITILENRQYHPANSTAPSSRPHSAQSFFTTFNPNICPSPSNTDQSSSITVQSPLTNISSSEELYLSPDDC